MFDLFNNQQQMDDFSWVVAMFQGNGASIAIKRASEVPLRTYYPIKWNGRGEPVPLWRNYLFLEFCETISLEICRSTTKFLKIISHPDEEGVYHPVLVPKNAINENLAMVQQGLFDERTYNRRFYGKGSLVRVLEGNFINKKVRLEADIPPDLPRNKTISISLGSWNGRIEVYKLAL